MQLFFCKHSPIKRCFFNDDKFFQSPLFSSIIEFVNSHAQQCRLKDEKGKPSLIVGNIVSIESANRTLQKMIDAAAMTEYVR